MLEKFSILAQLNLTAGVTQALYTVLAANNTKIQGMTVCNRSSSEGSFRVSIVPTGAGQDARHYIYYDLPISGNNTFMVEFEATLLPSDRILVYSASGNLSFTLYGQDT